MNQSFLLMLMIPTELMVVVEATPMEVPVYVSTLQSNRTKLEARARTSAFLGYKSASKLRSS